MSVNHSSFITKTVAEGERFELPEPCGSTVFKTAAIDHSANPPGTLTRNKVG